MALGDKRFGKGDVPWAKNISDVKAPNWVQNYPLFVSPSKSFDFKTVRDEYKFTLDKWLDDPKNKGADLNDFRKKHGIIIDQKGRELLTTEWKQARSRRLNEVKQTPAGGGRGIKRQGFDPKQPIGDKPWWNRVPEGKMIKLEGHHRVGLAHLGPFFEGSTPKQAFELRQRILNETDLGAVGTDKRNWEWLEKKQHDLAHKLYGYASDTEIADPKNKGLVFYDMELQGKKGQTSLGQTIFPGSAEFRKKLDAAPFDRPAMETRISNTGKYVDRGPEYAKGMHTRTGDPTKINLANLEEAGKYATKGDYLIEYLNMTDEAYKSSISQARKARPITIPGEVTRGKIPNVANPMAAPVLARSMRGWGPNGLMKTATGLNRAESVVRIAGGDVVGGSIGLAMTTPTFQKQIGKLLLKQGIKVIPGVSFGSGALQAAGYAMGGQWSKAGLSALGGVIGEIPGYGDVVQGAIDVGLTGHDQFGSKKPKIKTPGIDEDELLKAVRTGSKAFRW